MPTLVVEIRAAFAARPPPAEDEITRCGYDCRNGGAYAGPCWECSEMAEYFRGKDWRSLGATALRSEGQATALFTVEAYCYLLPAYLIAAIEDPSALDVGVDALGFTFGPRPDDEFGVHRVGEILSALRPRELDAVLKYFVHARRGAEDGQGFLGRAEGNLRRELSTRASAPGSALEGERPGSDR